MFEPSTKGHADTGTSSRFSVGLGPYITRRIVEAHGGSVEIESSKEAGTTVRIRLPRHPLAQQVSSAAPAAMH